MKQLLTYGLLLLTILASHFVVSACQDDLPDTTEVMLTFTTRAFVSAEETGEKSDALSEESMENLRVIMLDGDNNVVGNAVKENIEKSSVVFKFQTPVTIGEEFKFLAIANENSLDLENDLNAITTNLSDYENNWKKRVIDASLNPTEEKPLPQTKFWTWTYGVDAEDSDKLNPTLDYIGCKISVQFVNHTTKPQSLSNIYIAGASKGYLFKQDDNDFVSDASANIDLSPINELPASETSDAQHCYTYPKGNISSSPTLYATWNDVQYSLVLKDNQGNALTSLNRNDHLQIVVTLTPAGDIVVNYTIAEWEDASTTIGDEAPTTPGNGYNVDDFIAAGDIEIGGGSNNIWDLGNGTTIKGEEVNTGWSQQINVGGNDILTLTLPGDDIYALEGYYIFIEFRCQTNNGHNNFDIWFITDWGENHVISKKNADGKSYTWNENQMIVGENGQKIPNEDVDPYVRYMLLDKTALDMIYNYSNSKNKIITTTRPPEPDENGKYEQLPIHVFIETLTLIKPTTYSN